VIHNYKNSIWPKVTPEERTDAELKWR